MCWIFLYAVGKKKLLVQFEYGQNRDISDSLLLYLCEKEDFSKS